MYTLFTNERINFVLIEIEKFKFVQLNSLTMSCTTEAHKYEVKGYRHTKISYSSQITTKELITIEEWRSSSRWFGLQKVREYSRWIRNTTVSYSVEKDASSTIAIIECSACKQQLEVRSVFILFT